MKKYEIKRNSIEVKFAERKNIEAGITLQQDEQNPEVVASFETLEEAKEELKKYSSSIRDFESYYSVEEYYIEENEYDEDGDWVEGGDVWEYSKMSIKLVEEASYKTLSTFDNMEDAEKAYNEYDEDEVCLIFE